MQNILFWVKKYLKDLVLFCLIIICIGLIGYNFYHDEENKTDLSSSVVAVNDLEEEKEKDEEIITTLNIDIKGAVKKPGVYAVNNGAIINDIIKMAGGFNSNAYQNGINLSKKVTDEMVIYVYTKNEIKDKENKEDALNSCVTTTYDICDCVQDQESVIETKPTEDKKDNSLPAQDSDTTTKLVNINTASKAELTTISGIGETKALAIIEYRSLNGSFKSVTDLLNVNGIGEALFDKIKEFVTV